jgi:hypothetical protein
MPLSSGAHLGPYEILATIGAGGIGGVCEARATAAFSQLNILAIFNIGTHQGQAPSVEELLEGETLGERVRGQALPAGRVTDDGAQIASGHDAAQVTAVRSKRGCQRASRPSL